jgi:glutamyl-tRNA reductase
MFVCLGLSHRTAPAHVRERHTFHESTLSEVLVALLDYDRVREAAILSTCNRLEIYADLSDFEAGVAQLKQFLVSFRHGDVGYDIEPYLYVLRGSDGVDHLLRVATGLDSMLIGETEILGQVKAAYHRAQDARSCGPLLHHIFREVLSAGKRARAQTAIGTASSSIATAAVAIAKEQMGSLRGRTVLLIGAGNMALKAAQRLKNESPAHVIVTSRTLERARKLAARLGIGEATDIEDLHRVLGGVDVVISSTAASKFLLTPDAVAASMAERRWRPLCLLDIAVPRNVDPDVAHVPGVRLIDIDGVGSMMGPALQAYNPAIKSVEAIVDAGVKDFERWCQSRTVSPLLSAIAQKAESIRDDELQRLLHRCPQLSERERNLVIGMSLRVVSRLTHPAFSNIRNLLDGGNVTSTAIEALFDVEFERGETSARIP